jgi:hypothetical protein
MKKLNVKIEGSNMEFLKNRGKEMGVTLSVLIREILEDYQRNSV